MKNQQTDNSYLSLKVMLRNEHIKSDINVLNCFAGENRIWSEIIKQSSFKINLFNIDKKEYKTNTITGDNLKLIDSLDLNRFDMIDLDAYGMPIKQLELIFRRQYKGLVFITFIQSIYGQLDGILLNEYGYTKDMIKKIPSLFNKKGIELLYNYLAKRGIKEIEQISKNNKYYIAFSLV